MTGVVAFYYYISQFFFYFVFLFTFYHHIQSDIQDICIRVFKLRLKAEHASSSGVIYISNHLVNNFYALLFFFCCELCTQL
ncbi:MAG: hypothetical protein LBD23_07635 [Oscillospiraceae bacterium]|nr:hypothetical protein [Oscillospiraceae bacterium]